MNVVERWIADRYLRRLEDSMGSNWKGKVGALGVIAGAIAGLCVAYSNGTLTTQDLIGALTVIAGGFSAFGIRQAIGKVESPPQ